MLRNVLAMQTAQLAGLFQVITPDYGASDAAKTAMYRSRIMHEIVTELVLMANFRRPVPMPVNSQQLGLPPKLTQY